MLTQKKKIIISIVSVVFILLSILYAYSLLSNGDRKLPSSDTGSGPRISLIVGENGIEDPYYKKVWEGLEQAERELGATIGFVKAKNEKDYVAKLNELRNQKSQVIITLGPSGRASVIEAAKLNPSITYICLDSIIDDTVPANVLGVEYKVEEAAFLAGYIAGKVTNTNVIGFISGSNEDHDLRYYYGYKAGIRYGNPNCEVMKGLAATSTNKVRVEKLALQMVEYRADVIFHVAGIAGRGMINVMEKPGRFAIGSNIDENSVAPNHVLTSVIIHHDDVIIEILRQFQEKKLELGRNISLGLADKAVSIVESSNNLIPTDVYKKMLNYKENIIQGKLVIPANENDYYAFVNN